MKFIPHDYQQYAIEYIETHEFAAVLLDMGLGKTAITLTALYALLFDYFEITRVLVIAPLRVARNTWPQEIEKWDHLKDPLFCGGGYGKRTAGGIPQGCGHLYHQHLYGDQYRGP